MLENPESQERQENNGMMERLLKTRSIIIAGDVNQKLVERVTRELLILQDDNDQPIRVYINSQGGHVESGDTIFDLFRFIKPEIVVIGTGWVASAAITIFLGAEKKNRYSLPNTRYLIHQPAGGVMGSALDIKIEAEEIIKIRKRVNEIISERTGQALSKVEQDTERNFWMNAKEAREYGIVNKIIVSQTEID